MANRIKTNTELVIKCLFRDGDTRVINLSNPRSDILASEIENLEEFMQTEKIIIGDKQESEFWKIEKAIKRKTTTVYLDLE